MVRNQAVAFRTFRTRGGAILVTCPKCRPCSTFVRAPCPHIDSCGFESHSFRCEWCASFLAGIMDPSDGELVVSLLEEPSGVTAIPPSDPLSGNYDLQCDTDFAYREKRNVIDGSGSGHVS
jgi:hypothetical protein